MKLTGDGSGEGLVEAPTSTATEGKNKLKRRLRRLGELSTISHGSTTAAFGLTIVVLNWAMFPLYIVPGQLPQYQDTAPPSSSTTGPGTTASS